MIFIFAVMCCVSLQEHMASAWGIDESQPLIILVHILSISKYLEGLGMCVLFVYTCIVMVLYCCMMLPHVL